MERVTAEPIRIVYFGTPSYAIPALRALAADERVQVALVVTQPDRPAGRGRSMTPPAIKPVAETLGIPVYQPETLRTELDRAPIEMAKGALFVVAAFGKIFGPKLLGLPPLGAVNLHASMLPDYRGASPISAAILEGNFRTGVTLMGMETGLDTGPILAQRSIDIEPDDTTASLTLKLADVGAELLIDSLGDLLAGQMLSVPQDDAVASLTRPLVKADGWIDWSRPALEIERQVRAMWDWPRAWTTIEGTPIQIHQAAVQSGRGAGLPGSLTVAADAALVTTGAGILRVEVAQAPGGKPMAGALVLGRAALAATLLGLDGRPAPPDLPLIRAVTD